MPSTPAPRRQKPKPASPPTLDTLLEDAAQQAILPQEPMDEEKGGHSKAMNTTAFRIFRMLQWLIESPLSVEALNEKFCTEPKIGKPLSNDTIWLYINTLKRLGCDIRRPSPRNGFRYEMHSHPFGMHLTDAQIDALSQAKRFAQKKLSQPEMLALDSLLKKVVSTTDLENREQAVERLFTQSRSFDYEASVHHLETLEIATQARQLLEVTYFSPQQGEESFLFLPESIHYQEGVVYVRGERAEVSHASNLRLDRVMALEAVQDPALTQTLLTRRNERTAVVLHLLGEGACGFPGFQLQAHQGVYEENVQWIEAAGHAYCEVRLQVREWFYLQQSLLSCQLPFRIVSPQAFKAELRDTLSAMLRFYEDEHPVVSAASPVSLPISLEDTAHGNR